MNVRNRATLLAVGLVVLAGLGISEVVTATCGGGGGGGGGSMNSYQTQWVSFESARKKAAAEESAILIYLPREAAKKEKAPVQDHSVFATKPIAEKSAEIPFVKLTGEAAKEFREKRQLSDKGHLVYVTDWHTNEMTRFRAKKERDKIAIKKLVAYLGSAQKFVAKLEKDSAKDLKKAAKQLEKEKWGAAYKRLEPIAALFGIEPAETATKQIKEMLKAGAKRIEEALEENPDDQTETIVALSKIRDEYKGTPVADSANAEIDRLKNPEKASEREEASLRWVRPAAGERWATFRAEFEPVAVDEGVIDAMLAVQRYVVEGALAERMHRYERAKRLYEEAILADPDDAVALRYLAEYHRHHTGEWGMAREIFSQILELERADPYSRAIALHGIGKMTIHGGEFEKGISIIEKSIEVQPTQLAYRNLAVYWHSEKEYDKARRYVEQAVALNPRDPYTRVFEAVYIALDGRPGEALQQVAETPWDISMSYNLACVYSAMRDKPRTLELLEQHFQEYEFTDSIRAKEMWEARTDINFEWLFKDREFLAVTHLAEGR